jgi:MarR family transcriptional regulator, organic hydroperoxide resistance regulator
MLSYAGTMSTSPRRAQLLDELTKARRRLVADAVLFHHKIAEQLGINANDLQPLDTLELLGLATPKQLALVTGLTTGGITVVLGKLERARYIKRESNPDDGSSVTVRFLPKPSHRIYWPSIAFRQSGTLFQPRHALLTV